MFFGKGLISKVLYEKAYKACPFPATGPLGLKCHAVLEEVSEAVGPHNVNAAQFGAILARNSLTSLHPSQVDEPQADHLEQAQMNWEVLTAVESNRRVLRRPPAHY